MVDALSADASASALLTASTYRGNAGAGVVAAATATKLSDNLKAPATISRAPFQQKVLRIGKKRDGSKVGVFLYCQEHAREWVTSLVCVETAERLLRNYSARPADPEAGRQPRHLHHPGGQPRRRALQLLRLQHAAQEHDQPLRRRPPATRVRNSWGVDLNRNFTVGSAFDGYDGASTTSCTSGTFAGPAELSEPEAKNEVWLTEKYPNIKFAMNTHSYGGYFMWPPGAYKAGRPRAAAAGRPRYGELLLGRLRSHPLRGAVLPRYGDLARAHRSGSGCSVLGRR